MADVQTAAYEVRIRALEAALTHASALHQSHTEASHVTSSISAATCASAVGSKHLASSQGTLSVRSVWRTYVDCFRDVTAEYQVYKFIRYSLRSTTGPLSCSVFLVEFGIYLS